ncbi:MAG: hypothetical protein UZ07_CHB004000998, partial [Chlorobi bacterium OLB7]
DCNGDGWSDLLVNDPDWWGFDQGIAVILAGGPYIPHDDPVGAAVWHADAVADGTYFLTLYDRQWGGCGQQAV